MQEMLFAFDGKMQDALSKDPLGDYIDLNKDSERGLKLYALPLASVDHSSISEIQGYGFRVEALRSGPENRKSGSPDEIPQSPGFGKALTSCRSAKR
jgi:hypothetical protein